MSISPGAERVPLTGSTPAGPSPSAGGKGIKVDQKTLMMGGAVVVALIAYVSSRGGNASSGGNFDPVELDTTQTDLYTAVQPELEQINDQLDALAMRDSPAPPKPPTVIVNVNKPKPSGSSPKPKSPSSQPNVRVHTVRKGESLSGIARHYKVNRTRLYRANQARIEAAAKKHGKKNSGNGRWIYPGTVLVLP